MLDTSKDSTQVPQERSKDQTAAGPVSPQPLFPSSTGNQLFPSAAPSADLGFEQTPISPSAPDQAMDYPTLTLRGTGKTTFRDRIHDLASQSVIKVSQNEITSTLQSAKATVNCDFIGCKSAQEKVDEEVQKRALGTTKFLRSTPEEFRQLVRERNFKDAAYVIFAKGILTHQNVPFTFALPVPVIPYPGAKGRYAELDIAPGVWETPVTSPLRNFNLRVTVSKHAATNDVFQMKITIDIPEDQNGCLYEKFPMPKESIYSINHTENNILEINSEHRHCDEEEDNHPEFVKITYRLCSVLKGVTTKNFPCQ